MSPWHWVASSTGISRATSLILAPEIFNHHNIRRVKRRLALQLHARFQSANIVIDAQHTLCTRTPTAHERAADRPCAGACLHLGEQPHIPAPAPDRSLLETHFDGASTRSDWERIHALINPACVGLPRLVREYNASFPRESLACASRTRTTCYSFQERIF